MLADATADRLEELLEYFGIELQKGQRYYRGCCPVHGGDKKNALNLYHDGDSMIGNWKCHSHNCHVHFMPNIIGFVRGYLSHAKYRWVGKGDKEYSFHDTIQFLLDFTNNKSMNNIKVDLVEAEKTRFASHMDNVYQRKSPKIELKLTREQLVSSLQVPADYYLARGYSKEILEKYDVGLCETYGKPMYQRAVVPIYDEEHKYIVGCSGRSIWERCPLCDSYHNPTNQCPNEDYRWQYCKWRNNTGFKGEEYLYNYWFAKKFIAECGVAIIVESPGNIWRLEEAGIHIGLATFGAHLTDGQRSILDKSGALALIVLTDPDEAGRVAEEIIRSQCENSYSLYFPRKQSHDIGETSVGKVQETILPVVSEAMEHLSL